MAPARQILFFHPRYLARAVAVDSAALLEAPLKFVVMQLEHGETVVRRLDPEPSFSRYGEPDLTAPGRELARLCERIAADALAS